MKKAWTKIAAVALCIILGVTCACTSGTSSTATSSTTSTTTTTTTTTTSSSSDDSIIKEKRDIVILDAGSHEDLMRDEVVRLFKEEYPDYVGDVIWISASTGEQVSKLTAEINSNSPYTTLCSNGYDTVAAGVDAGVYINIMEKYGDRLAPYIDTFTDDAKLQLDKTLGYGIPVLLSIGGPMITYWPDDFDTVPTNMDELLQWASEHPGKFAYPRPSNSGAGYAWLQGLPYLLGEENPNDPTSWTKVWDYLKEMDQYIDYYTTGSALLYRDFNEGTRSLITTAVGYETNQRVLGAMSSDCKQLFLEGMSWITDANSWTIPVGLDPQDEELSMLFIEFTLRPEIQAMLYDHGFMYPGPVVEGVSLSDAPQESQDALNAVLTDDLLKAIEDYPHAAPMDMDTLVQAMEMWDEQIGANKLN